MAKRRHLDAYYTPLDAVTHLHQFLLQTGRLDGVKGVFEPCVGGGVVRDVMQYETGVYTNDLDRSVKADYYLDATQSEVWNAVTGKVDWCITNPPFTHAFEILKQARVRRLKCAFLLRLSFLEPTIARGRWLEDHPPQVVLVLPRISFTNDGKTDSVTTAWMIWDNKAAPPGTGVRVISRGDGSDGRG